MLLLINLLLVVDHIESSAVVDIHLHSLGLAPSFVLLKVSCLYSTPFLLASVTVDLTEQSLNGACCFGWPSVMLFSSAGIWYIYLCDHSDRCNLTLVKKSTCSVIWPSKVQFFLPCWCMMKLQGKGKDWQEGQGDEACRFIYFESITGSCSKKEGISFVFVKYSNVNAILFVTQMSMLIQKISALCLSNTQMSVRFFFEGSRLWGGNLSIFFWVEWALPNETRDDIKFQESVGRKIWGSV